MRANQAINEQRVGLASGRGRRGRRGSRHQGSGIDWSGLATNWSGRLHKYPAGKFEDRSLNKEREKSPKSPSWDSNELKANDCHCANNLSQSQPSAHQTMIGSAK